MYLPNAVPIEWIPNSVMERDNEYNLNETINDSDPVGESTHVHLAEITGTKCSKYSIFCNL